MHLAFALCFLASAELGISIISLWPKPSQFPATFVLLQLCHFQVCMSAFLFNWHIITALFRQISHISSLDRRGWGRGVRVTNLIQKREATTCVFPCAKWNFHSINLQRTDEPHIPDSGKGWHPLSRKIRPMVANNPEKKRPYFLGWHWGVPWISEWSKKHSNNWFQ